MITPIMPISNVRKLPLRQKAELPRADLKWARENIKGFSSMMDTALEVRASERKYKEAYHVKPI
jgi:hypothetical protein